MARGFGPILARAALDPENHVWLRAGLEVMIDQTEDRDEYLLAWTLRLTLG